MFLTHSDEALEIKKFKISRENKIEFAYDYGNLNASYVNKKINLEDDYFQEIINPDFDKIDSPFQQTSSLKPYVLNVILEKIITNLEDEVINLLEKEKVNLETIESLKSKDLDTFSGVRRPKNSGVIWKKKWSSNTSNVGLSADSVSNLNKNVKRYSRKDLLACNNSRLGETTSASMCNDAMNVSCNPEMCDLLDDNNFFIFDDVNVRISPVSKMPFRKNPSDSMQVRSKSNMIKSLPRTVHKWLPKLQPLAKLVAKWFPKVKHLDTFSSVRRPKNSGVIWKKKWSSNTSNVALSDGLEVTFRKSTCFVRNEDGVDLLTDEASEVIISSIKKTQVNLQLQVQHVRTDNGTKFKNKTLAKFFDEVGITQQFFTARTPQQNGVVERRNRTLVEAAKTMLTFANLPSFLWAEAIATACFTQNRLIIYKRFDKTPYELINKRKPKIKFFHVFGCRCYLLNDYEDVGKLKEKGDIGVFVGYSKDSASHKIIRLSINVLIKLLMSSLRRENQTLSSFVCSDADVI
nr:integrase, catalytic region, zinc finger, CCHC-type, peptidase aspartic, catalytic [Tanacetum cinerariifolium]